MNWKRTIIPTAVVLIFVAILWMGFGNNPHEIPNVHLNQPAPSFTLVDLNGEPVSFAQLKGKPTVVNFWSTWCEPCKYEHEVLQEGAKRFGQNVNFVGVIYQDSPEKARTYLAGKRNIYRQLVDPNSVVAIEYGVSGVPESYFIDAQGVVRSKVMQALSWPALQSELANITRGGSAR